MSDLNFTIGRIEAYASPIEEDTLRDLSSYCSRILDEFSCESRESTKVGTVLLICQNIHEKVEEQNKKNWTQEAFQLRRANMEAYIRNAYGNCENPQFNCVYKNKNELLQRYENIIKENVVYHQSFSDNVCGHAGAAYEISSLLTSQENIYYSARPSLQYSDYEYVLNQSEKCISVCEAQNASLYFTKDCYLGKAAMNAKILGSRAWTVEESIKLRTNIAESLQKAEFHNDSGDEYSRLAAILNSNSNMIDKIVVGFLGYSASRGVSSWENAYNEYNLAANYQKRNEISVILANIRLQTATKTGIAQYGFYVVCVCIAALSILKSKKDSNEIVIKWIVYWDKARILLVFGLLINIWIGIAVFAQPYFELTSKITSLNTEDKYNGFVYTKLFNEIPLYSNFYIFFLGLGTMLVLVILGAYIRSLPAFDETTIRRVSYDIPTKEKAAVEFFTILSVIVGIMTVALILRFLAVIIEFTLNLLLFG